MMLYRRAFIRGTLALTAFLAAVNSPFVIAGGVSLGTTRIIYPLDARQVSLPVSNSDDKSRFLIQSWTEDAYGKKTIDFTVSPHLFMIGPEKENSVRIVLSRTKPLPSDRETLYWFNAQAIPQHDTGVGENILQLASLSRIKLFVRPAGLHMKASESPEFIRFSRTGGNLVVHNPTPYHVTLVSFREGSTFLPNTMVPPKDSVTVKAAGTGAITFSTINDYGAITPEQKGLMK